MLESMRRGAQSMIARLFFVVLIGSFAIWGIPRDFVGASNDVAQIGSTAISADSFRRAFDSQLNSLSQQNKGKIDRDVAVKLGLDRAVLESLIGQGALLQMAEKMKLGVSDETLAAEIKADPEFAGPDGTFSKLNFDSSMQQAGLSEQGLFKIRRENELRSQLTDAMTSATVAPQVMAGVRRGYDDETRTLAHVTIDADKKIAVADPDDAQLNSVYNENKSRFKTDETRKLSVLTLTVEDMKGSVQVTDDDLQKSYADTKASFDKPEKRRVQQIAFKDKATAEDAKKVLAAGTKNFMDVAKDNGAKESDVNLGLIAKAQMLDPVIAEAVFGAKRDEVTGPVEGKFSTVLVRVIEIEDGKISTFDGVKDKVRDAFVTKKAEAAVQEKVNLVIEARNAGKTLKEIADDLKLKFFDVESVTADNKSPNGPAALNFPDARKLIEAAFITSPGSQSDAVELGKAGYAWFDTLAVTPAREKTFDEAKDAVKALYKETERNKLLDELANKLVDRLKAGEDTAKVALDAGGKVETTEDLKRVMSAPGLGNEAIRLAFELAKDASAQAASSDGQSRVIFKVLDIKPAAPPSKEEADRLTQRLKTELANDNLYAFVDGLKSKLGVTTNSKLLKRLVGADAQ